MSKNPKRRSNSSKRQFSKSTPASPEKAPQHSVASFPIVGVGASAGGLEAFTKLLKHLPTDTGMAFVLVQHLDPSHESALTTLLSRATSMPVREVANNLQARPNCVYVIPPNTTMFIARGVLKLSARGQKDGAHRSIDSFFESLAEDHRERAIGVILSGSATDGTAGLEAIKAEGGITFAQDGSARYDSMPRNAVAAGCVDFVLPPESIANELARIARHPYVSGDPLHGAEADRHASTEAENEPTPLAYGGQGAPPAGAEQARAGEQQDARGGMNGFKKILMMLRNHSGVDFSLYKSNTIHRRITRRVVLNKQDSVEDYAAFLKGNAKELDALYSDVLISVTSFFRNPEAFAVLKRNIFPRLTQHRHDEPMRVWVVGCSTGQEAYSIAMAYAEFSRNVTRAPRLQVFATDLNDGLLAKARGGLYAKSLAQDVSPERLRRFFVEEEGGYRLIKALREQVVFARQNVISDPPFSRVDLVSCRNLMIYFDPGVQKKVIQVFHYALKPGGILFLGASESVGQYTDLFELCEKKHKIFAKKPAPTPAIQVQAPKEHGAPMGTHSPRTPVAMTRTSALPEGLHGELNAQREADRLSVNRFAPPGVLINAELQIVQFRGTTSPYLQPPTGHATFNVLKMAREGLMLPLRAAINKAKRENKPARRENIRINQNGSSLMVNVEVIPLKNLKERNYLILFEPSGAQKARSAAPAAPPPRQLTKREESRHLAELERELGETRDYVQSIQEQYEAAAEELQSSNEEVQSGNEELQSINEELETSKEELESTNEELTTANEEMTHRNVELSRANADMANLLVSINTPLLVLARDLTIRRFTPQAEKIFNLLPTDIGRPLSGIKHNLDFPRLENLVSEVIDTVRMQEREVQSQDNRWHLLRVRPYMTLDNKIDGAVLLLLDIDALKRSEQEAKAAHEYAQATIRTAPDALVVLRSDLRVNSANQAFYRMFRSTPRNTEGRPIFELGNGQWKIPRLRELLEDILPRKSFFTDFEVVHEFPDIGKRTMLVSGRRLEHEMADPAFILMTIEDVTERLESRAALKRSETRYRRLFEAAQDGILILNPVSQKITDANPFMTQLLGCPREELLGKEPWELGLLKDERASQEVFRELQEKGCIRVENITLQAKTGERRELELIGNLYDEDEQKVAQFNIRDITERRRLEAELREGRNRLANRAGELERLVGERMEDLTAINKQLETFVYTIAHDLRAPLRAMQGFAALLMEEETQLSETGKDYSHRISDSALHMDALLRDLLAFSQLSQTAIELVPVNLETVVQPVLSRMRKEFPDRDMRVEASGEWPNVLAHAPTLGQVLTNLISNGLKFVAPGTQPLVKLWAEDQGEFVRTYVEDNGVGIAPEHQKEIFRPFVRLQGDKFKGTGIGLSIVEKGVERLHGRVGLDSTVGKGSRFWFELRKA